MRNCKYLMIENLTNIVRGEDRDEYTATVEGMEVRYRITRKGGFRLIMEVIIEGIRFDELDPDKEVIEFWNAIGDKLFKENDEAREALRKKIIDTMIIKGE